MVPPPPLPGLYCLSPNEGSKVWLTGLSFETTPKDFGICQSPTTLGQPSQTHSARQAMPAGGVHQGVEGVDGAIYYFY